VDLLKRHSVIFWDPRLFDGFNCILPMPGVEGKLHRLVFVDQYWPSPPDIWKGGNRANRDILSTEFGCRRLYAGSPAKIYTAMRVDCILGPAHIGRADPVHRTILLSLMHLCTPAN